MPICRIDCVQKWLENAFYNHGKRVARHPLIFLMLPIIISAISCLGLITIHKSEDTEYLYTPKNGPAKEERKILQNLFPENDSQKFEASRKSGSEGFLNVIITATDDENLFTTAHMKRIVHLDSQIQSKTVTDESRETNYTVLCGSWFGNCHNNYIIGILQTVDLTDSSAIENMIRHPIHENTSFLGYQLGGVEVNDDGYVVSAKAVFLSYFIKYETADDKRGGDVWMTDMLDFIKTYDDNITKVFAQTSRSVSDEINTSMNGIIPRFAVTYILLFIFCVCSCSMTDVVRCKTWVVISGLLAAALSFLTAMGMLNGSGIPIISTVGSTPFLIAGVGIDNMFVILSAWRHTSYMLSVEERMGLTFKTAAISITVTTVTDAFALATGAITVFRAVTIFCAYTVLSIVCSYLYAITFVAACFALSGRSEAANRHDLCCFKVVPKEKSEHASKIYNCCCTGGNQLDDGDNDIEDNEEEKPEEETHIRLPLITHFINNHLAPFLMKTPVRVIVMALYMLYLGCAVIGCLKLQEGGLKVQNLVSDKSYLLPYFNLEDEYFKSVYGPRVMVVIFEDIDYTDSTEREYVLQFLQSFTENPVFYNHNLYTESWLSAYLMYLDQTNRAPENMSAFIEILRTEFLTNPLFSVYQLDIFNSDFSSIQTCRFLLQARGVHNTNDERKLMTEAREIASTARFKAIVYHSGFIYFDQYTVIFNNTFQNIGIAVASMLVVSLVLLPSFVSVLWVTLSVISICTGVLGYMVIWGVSLNSVSMINLIMCIGFSVDFSAHISYHFAVCKASRSHHKAQEALGQIGTPIIQGAISTVLGVIVLATSDCYIFRTFFKIMFLVMVFGFLHAIFFLPVVLSLIDCYRQGVVIVSSHMQVTNSKSSVEGSDISSIRCMW